MDHRKVRVGMAVNIGEPEKKKRLIELLLEAETLSLEVGLWVQGNPFDETLKGVIGGLQRSLD
jgi:hypothetical protein